ncbi:MAG: 4-(cytidine 5'-diphospho)-2-C-methyl-D-erythritol kinase [Eubacteriales bacterium]|nr:4-(cytidine 5'-diphospho)-2-C-methyl-D-erythritol kinase [Eubacteriales bacterium]
MRELNFTGTEAAPAKINLSLEVLGRRPDNYHNLESLMVTVDLCDQLSLFLRSDEQANWRVSSDRSDVPQGEKNIAYVAALAFFRWYQINPDRYSLDLRIEKNIPSQAGLGGGSSDAAATLRLLERAFFPDGDFEAMPLSYMARGIGADVPFCYRGGTQFVSSIGDVMGDYPPFPNLPLLLFKPPINVSTKNAFDALGNRQLISKTKYPSQLRQKYSEVLSSKNYSELSTLCKNSFLPLLLETHPEIADYLQALQDTDSVFVSLSGSGPTLFALYDTGTDTNTIAGDLQRRFPQVSIYESKILSKQ